MTTTMTLGWLEGKFNYFPAEIKSDKSRREFTLFAVVLCRVFGQGWCEQHIMNPNGADASGYLKLDFTNDIARELKSLRMAHLAEMVFNLHTIPGFDSCIAQMKNGEIEFGFAELEFGKLLYINDVEFRFVDPRNRAKGEAYDYEVTFPDGLIACADAKCKIEGGEATATSVENTLIKARKQLPKNRPGIIFVKVQPHWFTDPKIYSMLGDVTRDFFRNTRRIISVKYFVNQFDYLDDAILHTHRYREMSNPRNCFDPTRTWQLFKPSDQQSMWNGMPSKWVRLINFEPRGTALSGAA
jgi:hypothetical protein